MSVTMIVIGFLLMCLIVVIIYDPKDKNDRDPHLGI